MCRIVHIFCVVSLALFLLVIEPFSCRLSLVEAAQTTVRLQNFTVDSPTQETLRFSMSQGTKYNIMMLKGSNPRLVIDFMRSKFGGPANQRLTGGNLTTKLRSGYHQTPVEKSRVVIDLENAAVRHNADFDPNTMILSVVISAKGTKPATVKQQKTVSAIPSNNGLGDLDDLSELDNLEAEMEESLSTQQVSQRFQETASANQSQRQQKAVDKTTATEITQVVVDEKEVSNSPIQPVAEVTEKPTNKAKTEHKTVQISKIAYDIPHKGEERIRFQLNGFYPPNLYADERILPRVFCEFIDAEVLDGVEKEMPVNGDLVRRIMVREKEGSSKLEAVIELAEGKDFNLHQIFFKDESLFVVVIREVE